MMVVEVYTDKAMVADGTPHAGYYIAAATLPGQDIDVITVGPMHATSLHPAIDNSNRMHFYVALHRIGTNRPYGELGSLLAPKLSGDDNEDTWDEIYKEMAQPVKAVSSGGLLDITVLEWLTAAMPTPQTTIDDTTAQGLKNAHLEKLPTKQQYPTELMTSRRVGHLYISTKELTERYRLRNASAMTLPLRDLNAPDMKPIDRGVITVRFIPQQTTTPIGVLSQLNPKTDVLSPFEDVSDLCNEFYKSYIVQYIRAFPPFKDKFRLVREGERDALHFNASDDRVVVVGGRSGARFVPDKADMNDIHMPTGRIDGQPGLVPIHLLFSSVSTSREHTDQHDAYYGTLCDNCCLARGTTSEKLATVIHGYLDNPSGGLTVEMLAAGHLLGDVLTPLASSQVYRADVVLGGKGSTDRIRACEDIARDMVTGITKCGDCEDAAFCVHAVAATLLQGSYQINSATNWQERDPLWRNVYRSTSFFQGGWRHVGLDALQRLLSYYAVVSILGTVTGAFPGDRGRAPATRIRDLDAAERRYQDPNQSAHPDVQEIRRYLYTEEVNRRSSSEAHRWCLALPLRKVVDLVLKGFREELAAKAVRHPSDQEAMLRLSRLQKHIPAIELPSLTLEGTTPLDPYCVVGASHWLPTDKQLRALEARARALAIDYRDQILPKWYSFGAEQLDAGAYRHLPGNLSNRQGSQFYSRALQLDAWVLAKLTDSVDMTTFSCNHGLYGTRWGVPVDKLLAPTIPSDVCLFSTTHRISYALRQQYNAAGSALQTFLLPASRLGSVNILEPATAKLSGGGGGKLGLETFEWSVYYLRGGMFTSDAMVEEYKRQLMKLAPTNDTIIEYRQKPLVMGQEVLVWAIRNLQQRQ